MRNILPSPRFDLVLRRIRSAIEWPTATTARVKLAGFPLDQMPEFARNLFRARLETILDDAKTKFGTKEETAIDLVDADKGTTMEHITH